MQSRNEVVITGIGLLSCLGVGAEQTWRALKAGGSPIIDMESFAPYPVHPIAEIDWSAQIPKRGDLRQMEAWQKIGTFAAGLALEDADLKDDEAMTTSMDMVIAAAGGERDIDVDTMIIRAAAEGRNDHDVLINEVLTTELRPTLFLAQLSNLLAGNISIVHKVTGSSRTFMGEEGAGISAFENAVARIGAGQSSHALIGGAYNCEHADMLLGTEICHHLTRGGWAPVYERDGLEGGGIILGSGAAFLVLESREHADARGATCYATVGPVASDLGPGGQKETVERLNHLAEKTGMAGVNAVVSAATGAHARVEAEKQFIADALGAMPVHAIASRTGSTREAQFLFASAVAALALAQGEPVPAMDDRPSSAPAQSAPQSIGIVALGQDHSEGMAILHASGDGSV